MAYVNVYPSRINWENDPSISTPLNATNLNKIDYAVYEHDRTLETWDTTKANESDLLLSVKSIDYDDEMGVFTFTWQNGTTKTVDLNIEKIPVSFSMDANGVITMTTDDGTTYTADVGSLIKTYTFTDSAEIDFTVTTDASGNKTVTAGIVAGSITGSKLEPNYLANCQSAAGAASGSADAAEDSAEDAEAWAVGERNGVPVASTDPTYHNNSKYWSEQANPTTLSNLTDVDLTTPANDDVLKYNSTSGKWENGAGGGGSLATLSDCAINQPSGYDVVMWDTNNSKWANQVMHLGQIDEVNEYISPQQGDALVYTNGSWEAQPPILSSIIYISDVNITSPSNRQVLTYNSTSQRWINSDVKGFSVGTFAVDLTNWSTDTTSQSGVTLYKKAVSVSHVYVDSPSVDIGCASGSLLPTSAEQESYNLLQYVTVDNTVPCLYLYASAIPTTAFYIKVTGVD